MKYEQWNLRRGGSDEARRQLELAGVPPLCAVCLLYTSPSSSQSFRPWSRGDRGL